MKKRRVVVTGLGVVSSVGIGWKPFWESLLAGRSGISEITAFDTTNFPIHFGGQVKKFQPEQFIPSDQLRRYNRASQFAIAASKMALDDARLVTKDLPVGRVGVIVGTTMAEAQAIEAIDTMWVERSNERVDPRLIPQYPANVIGGHIGLELNLRGPNLLVATACAAGNYAISYACDLLRLNKVDVVIAGGADAFSRIAFMGFNRLLAMAPERCQPFDKNRKGMMLGEGAGILILERLGDAKRRNAPMYAELLGYGVSCDANHMTIPDTDGVSRVMENALQDASLAPRDIGYINAHGTGTRANDRNECAAIRSVFGSHTDHLPVSSTKSIIGHTMGAASALEAIACVLAVAKDQLPPTINFEEPDPECDVDCVANISRSHEVRAALNNSFAFGGNNASTVFGNLCV